MNKYVVAYMSLNVGLLQQRLITADSELQAINIFLGAEYESLDDVEDVMAGSDSWIDALNINDALAE